jgi:hypothetical protein
MKTRYFITYRRAGCEWKVDLNASNEVEALETAAGFCLSAIRYEEKFEFIAVTVESTLT